MSLLGSAVVIALCLTLLIVLGGARLIGVKLTRCHALPIMAVIGAGLTLVVLIESGQFPLADFSFGAIMHLVWKPALINAGVVLGIYITGVSVKDYWHPPQLIEHNGKLIPTKWVIGLVIVGLISVILALVFGFVIHRFDIFLFLCTFGIGVFVKSLGIYLARDKARDVKGQNEAR